MILRLVRVTLLSLLAVIFLLFPLALAGECVCPGGGKGVSRSGKLANPWKNMGLRLGKRVSDDHPLTDSPYSESLNGYYKTNLLGSILTLDRKKMENLNYYMRRKRSERNQLPTETDDYDDQDL